MTAISYPDRETVSESGRFRLEARSPHNGTISYRDGRMASEDDYKFKNRDHQSEFRYQLLDNADSDASNPAEPKIVWERFQERREDSPGEIVVSDDGWSIIRTHGFSPEVIAVAPDGREVLRIRLTGEKDLGFRKVLEDSLRPVWILSHLVFSTIGLFWSMDSWRFFFRYQDRTYFTWRPWWGQRLVLDLERGIAHMDEPNLPEGLVAAMLDAERAGVRHLLGSLSRQLDEAYVIMKRPGEFTKVNDPFVNRLMRTASALHLVGVHRISDCAAYLREWEMLDLPGSTTQSSAMPGRLRHERHRYRQIVQHALIRLGEEPGGYPSYEFLLVGPDSSVRISIPSHLHDRADRARNLDEWMTAMDVLRLLGSPNVIRRRTLQVGRPSDSVEDWEYDFREGSTWRTLRISWKEEKAPGRTSAKKKRSFGRITAIEEIAPDWLHENERGPISFLWR